MKIQGITIHKNKKCNTWYTRYRKDGEQIYISAKTQKECYNLLKEKLNIEKKEKIKTYTLQSWYEKWLELFKIGKVKETTIKDYKSLLKHINQTILKKKIKEITEIEIIDQINNVDGERAKQKVYEFIKDIFTKATKYKIIKENIFDKIEKPKHIKINGTALTQDEQIKFIKQCENEKNGYIFLIMLYQGLRKGEALALNNNDINLNKNIMTINKNLDKTNKIGTTKNIYSNRTIPIFNKTIDVFKKLNINESEERICKKNNQKLHIIFKQILEKAGIKTKHTIHDLRHTFITNCKNINIPEHIIQSIVGHRIGSRITSEVYTHTQENIVSDSTNLINKFYSNSTQKKED